METPVTATMEVFYKDTMEHPHPKSCSTWWAALGCLHCQATITLSQWIKLPLTANPSTPQKMWFLMQVVICLTLCTALLQRDLLKRNNMVSFCIGTDYDPAACMLAHTDMQTCTETPLWPFLLQLTGRRWERGPLPISAGCTEQNAETWQVIKLSAKCSDS